MTRPVTRPTRRTVVRAAAWSAPALTIAATAPPAAASTPLQLVLNPADAGVVKRTDGRYDLYLRTATITAFGGQVDAGTLLLEIQFISAADGQPKTSSPYPNIPFGWSPYTAPTNVVVANLTYPAGLSALVPLQILQPGEVASPVFRTPLNTAFLPGEIRLSVTGRTPGPVRRNFLPDTHQITIG